MAERDEAEKETANNGNIKKKIIMIVAGVLLLSVGAGGSLYFTGVIGGGGQAEEEAIKAANQKKDVPIYFAFPSPFTVNFETESGLRFLQVNMEVMSFDQKAIDAVNTHMPVLKNNMILLLSSQSYADLISLEGKEELRKRALHEIQSILEKYYGEPGIEEVYFTNFVMQ